MINSPSSFGIPPSDILIRSAILEGIKDIKANPYLLDFLFNWFSFDTLTYSEYGDTEKQRAKDWIMRHNINVAMNYRVDDPKFPLVSIGLQQSSEDKNTLADVNYDTTEDVEIEEISINPKAVLGPFTPSAYDSATGIVTFPAGTTTALVYPNMRLFDSHSNIGYAIIDVLDAQRVTIAAGIKANFGDAYVTYTDSNFAVQLEAAIFKEVYTIKCFAQSEPVFILYLHALVEFILLRYRQNLLESRGMDSSSITSGPVYSYTLGENSAEKIWGRDITVTGIVRKYWPKQFSAKVQGIGLGGIEILEGTTPPAMKEEVKKQGWGFKGDFDSVG